ncbi:MAG: serine/threonine protein kinase [Myxococcales bacterium]|nr:serine/threonine protein kinase [Myxococcales bacterium]
MSIPLGPFDLLHPAGRGAMGEVWQARHRVEGVGVAVKVVTAPIGRRRRFRTAFAHELRAVARLDHPGIVRIYDHGEIGPEAAAERMADRVGVGAPYLVMEWIDGGSLREHRGRMPWSQLRAVLLALLDALGHAHARGVIHRDLKPDNVLFAERGPVLTDFGVAYTAERAAEEREALFAGTPHYMAPEQVTGDLRAMGPWTDLYALGCLAFSLATGHTPFSGTSTSDVARAQLLAPPPNVPAGTPVPPGFEAWLHRLLAKRVEGRYQFAADVAWDLARLSDDAPAPPVQAVEQVDDPTVVDAPIWFSRVSLPPAPAPAEALRLPPMPDDWRRAEPAERPMPLLGVGCALFGLRALELSGREAERDRLWAALGAVVAGQRVRAVLLEG